MLHFSVSKSTNIFLMIFQVKVVLYKVEVEKVSLKFDAKSSSYLNWFSASKLLSSPWTDVKSERKNYFAIQGGCHPVCRSFFINRNYGGCGADAGWLVIAGKACAWEKKNSYPSILYSTKPTYTNWNHYGTMHIRAYRHRQTDRQTDCIRLSLSSAFSAAISEWSLTNDKELNSFFFFFLFFF